MPKLILRCNYLKNAPPSHLQNFVQYIGTREGVEKVSDTTALLPATAKQKELIQDILNRIEDADRIWEMYSQMRVSAGEAAAVWRWIESSAGKSGRRKSHRDMRKMTMHRYRPCSRKQNPKGKYHTAQSSIIKGGKNYRRFCVFYRGTEGTSKCRTDCRHFKQGA